MSYSFEYIDIILLAMIAGFIFLRLRGILGKRTGFEGKTPPQFDKILKEAVAKKTSLNSTTGAAMGAAGVGGMTTEVAKNAAFGTGNAVKLTLGNYKVQTFDIYNLKASANTYLKGQVTDSSDNLVTGSSQYFNTNKVNDSIGYSDRMTIFTSWDLPTSSSPWVIICNIEVYDAYSSTKQTRLKIDYRRQEPPGTSYPSYDQFHRFEVIIRGTNASDLRNQSLYFTFGGSVPTFNSGITYDSYGMGTS